MAVHQPKCDCLVPHQRLVVALYVGDVCFAPSAVEQRVVHLLHVPVFVPSVAQQMDPIVRNAHGQAIPEPQSSFLHRAAGSRHPAHVFGNGQGSGVARADQGVGRLKVQYGRIVGILAEILVVAVKGLVAVVVVQHGGYPVEAESVETKFLHPVGDVGQQELLDVHLSVVEQFGIPSGMDA